MIKTICKKCGKEFEVSQSLLKIGKGKYCSRKCYCSGKVERKCQNCGNIFNARVNRIKKGGDKFCSRTCAGIFRRTKINVFCHECGSSFLANPSALSKGDSKFCSRECWQKNISGKRYGDKNPHWKGEHHEFVGAKGYVFIRCPGHHRALHEHVKRATIMAEKKIGRLLLPGEVVHHINGLKNDDSPENLEIISQSEHAKKHIENGLLKGRRNVRV